MWSVRIEPKTATEMEATMIVRLLLPKPDGGNRGEGGFRQTVEHDEIRLQNL